MHRSPPIASQLSPARVHSVKSLRRFSSSPSYCTLRTLGMKRHPRVVCVSNALRTGRVEEIEAYLDSGGDPNDSAIADGVPPIVCAAACGHANVVKLLLKRGSVVDAVDPASGRTALHEAAATGQVFLAKICIGFSADVEKKVLRLGATMAQAETDEEEEDARCRAGCYTPLQLAAGAKSGDMIRELIAAGARLDVAESSTGDAVMHRAAVSGSVEVVERLLKAGADLEAMNARGERPLHVAARNESRLEVVQCLVRLGADLSATDSVRRTPLHVAAENGCSKILKELVRSGADASAVTAKGVSALSAAAEASHVPVILALLRLGLQRLGGRRAWADALFSSARTGTVEAMKHLLPATAGGRRGGTAMLPGKKFLERTGTSPLHRAAAAGNFRCVRILLEAGADETALDRNGHAPLAIVGTLRKSCGDTHSGSLRAGEKNKGKAEDERIRRALLKAFLYRSTAWLWPLILSNKEEKPTKKGSGKSSADCDFSGENGQERGDGVGGGAKKKLGVFGVLRRSRNDQKGKEKEEGDGGEEGGGRRGNVGMNLPSCAIFRKIVRYGQKGNKHQ